MNESTTAPSQDQVSPDSIASHTIFASLVSIRGDLAILRTENNQEIIWPVSKLPAGLKQGDELNLIASTSPILETGKLDNEKSKRILEMILNG